MSRTVMIMAGGTGGHVFPALAIAGQLRSSREIVWLGTERGIEARVVPAAGYPVEWIEVGGLRGKGAAGWLASPITIVRAVRQALAALRAAPARRRARLRRLRLRPGRDRGLALRRAARDPRTECGRGPHQPLARAHRLADRRRISGQLPRVARRAVCRQSGAARDRDAPAAASALRVAQWPDAAVRLRRQPGRIGAQHGSFPKPSHCFRRRADPGSFTRPARGSATRPEAAYRAAGVQADVRAFIDDMAAAYANADLVVSRAGASTVSELAAVGVGSILVPFPAAVDDHQTKNAEWLRRVSAAQVVQETG